MPIERKPKAIVPPNTVRPDHTPHRVKDGESWETLSAQYGVAAETIILANFQTLVPAEVNWYLHHQVGCKKPTRDGNNWMFSSSATPGIIQIPPKLYVFHGETITVKHPYADIDVSAFWQNDTHLGKFSHGNFDVRYVPSKAELVITLRVKFQFESGITAAEQMTTMKNLVAAVKVWDNAPFFLRTSQPARNQVIDMRFKVVTGVNPHKVVDVENEERREWVGMDLNVHKGTSLQTYVHELGHVFGNYDEYDGSGVQSWLERRMWWHDNDHLADTRALMNNGTEFRARYFDHFADFVNSRFRVLGVTYRAVTLGP